MAAESPLPPNSPETGDKPQVAEEKGTAPSAAATAATTATATPASEAPRVEVSAATITRMMGIATTNDLRLLEGRIDVLTSKVAALLGKVERVLTQFNALPSSSDVDRLEIQIGGVKNMLRELGETIDAARSSTTEDSKQAASEQSRKIREGIKSN
jgi:hypothetical protein